jgi:hypothetical protein
LWQQTWLITLSVSAWSSPQPVAPWREPLLHVEAIPSHHGHNRKKLRLDTTRRPERSP